MNFLIKISVLLLMISTSMAFFGRSGVKKSFGFMKTSNFSLAASPTETATTAINANKVMVFSKTQCPFCKRAKQALTDLNVDFGLIELDGLPNDDGRVLQDALKVMTGQGTVPNIFVNGKHLGGCDSTLAAIASGELQKMLAK